MDMPTLNLLILEEDYSSHFKDDEHSESLSKSRSYRLASCISSPCSANVSGLGVYEQSLEEKVWSFQHGNESSSSRSAHHVSRAYHVLLCRAI